MQRCLEFRWRFDHRNSRREIRAEGLDDWTDILQTKMSNDGGNDLAAILSEVDTNVTNIQASLQSLDSKIGMMDTVSQRTLFQ